MCVGGWLCNDRTWKLLEHRWQRQISIENKLSGRLNLKPLSRYKAADLSARKGEYEGWTPQREVLFTKRLIGILGKPKPRVRPIGIACGVSFADLLTASPEWDRKHTRHKWERAAYRLCMWGCLKLVLDTIAREYSEEKAAVVHDRGKFNGPAQSAFDAIRQNTKFSNRDALLSLAPMDWETCTALQPADMMAFEGRKLVKAHPGDVSHFRRSLQRMIGEKLKIRVHNLPLDGLKETIEKHLHPPD
jgi:hypothetical protein